MERAEKNRLAEQAMRTVDTIVLYMVRRFGGQVDKDEIRSFALSGLADAIERYDADRNIPIGAFAAPRIKGAVYDGITGNSHLPRRLARQVAFYRSCDDMMRYEADLPQPSGKVETAHRLADRLKDLACAYVTNAVDEEALTDNAAMDPEELVHYKKYMEQLGSAISSLSPKQRFVVEHFFYKEESLSHIAAQMGNQPAWASRCLAAALQKMRKKFRAPP